MSLDFWQKLPAYLQQIFTEVWKENVAAYRANMAAAQARARDLMLTHGIRITVPAGDTLAAKREEMLAHQEQVALLSRISPAMVAAVTAELAAG
jgi:C4-dicarboxylate-binding protein DctP